MSEGIAKGLLLLAVVAGSLDVAWGGTIVNINALQNGENAGNESCSITCNGSLIDPVQVTFGPGTYQLNDAWSSSSGLEAGALYDAWSFQAGNPTAWAWHWKVLLRRRLERQHGESIELQFVADRRRRPDSSILDGARGG